MTDITKLKVDPELGHRVHPIADAFPLMAGAEWSKFVEDIRDNGLRDPIEYIEHDGHKIIVDGRNRLRACRITKRRAKFVERAVGSEADLLKYVCSKNLFRRHLSASQRAMVAASHQELVDAVSQSSAKRKAKGQKSGGRGKKKLEGKVAPKKNSAEALAEAAKVSPRTMKDAVAVEKSGDKKLVEDVKAGKTSVSKAAKQVRKAKAPPKESVTDTDGDAKFYKDAASCLERVYDRLCDSLGSADPVCAKVNEAIQLAKKRADAPDTTTNVQGIAS